MGWKKMDECGLGRAQAMRRIVEHRPRLQSHLLSSNDGRIFESKKKKNPACFHAGFFVNNVGGDLLSLRALGVHRAVEARPEREVPVVERDKKSRWPVRAKPSTAQNRVRAAWIDSARKEKPHMFPCGFFVNNVGGDLLSLRALGVHRAVEAERDKKAGGPFAQKPATSKPRVRAAWIDFARKEKPRMFPRGVFRK